MPEDLELGAFGARSLIVTRAVARSTWVSTVSTRAWMCCRCRT
jgi:hypothetical protein